MQIGFLATENGIRFMPVLEKMLSQKGHELVSSLYVGEGSDFVGALNYVAMQSQAVIYYGDRNKLFDTLKNDYRVDPELSVFELNDTLYAVMDEFSESFVLDSVIPLLNSRCKTYYTTVAFKTFGKTEEELREMLKSYIKNRSRIAFSFYPSCCECEVDVRYSSKMSRETVDALVGNVARVLKDCTYAVGNVTLAEQINELLKACGRKVCVAESFTGGAISSAITRVAGASEVFGEGIVCYGNKSKVERLGVDEQIISDFGAVSADTVYEMAANVLQQSGCDICLATSGNAGPTSEKEGEVGRCFIAVGDMKGIHIFEHNFSGNRENVTECGVKYAMYYLYKKLKACEAEIDRKSENKE